MPTVSNPRLRGSMGCEDLAYRACCGDDLDRVQKAVRSVIAVLLVHDDLSNRLPTISAAQSSGCKRLLVCLQRKVGAVRTRVSVWWRWQKYMRVPQEKYRPDGA